MMYHPHNGTHRIRVYLASAAWAAAILFSAALPARAGTETVCEPNGPIQGTLVASPATTVDFCTPVTVSVLDPLDLDAIYIKSPRQFLRYESDVLHFEWTVPPGITDLSGNPITDPGNVTYFEWKPTTPGNYHFEVKVCDEPKCAEADDDDLPLDIDVTVQGSRWEVGSGLQCSILLPANNSYVLPGQTVTVTCRATDTDLKFRSDTGEPVLETSFQYTWSCFYGSFKNDLGQDVQELVTSSPRVKWTAPNSGSDTVSVTVSDQSDIGPIDCGERDDATDAGAAIELNVSTPTTTSPYPDPAPPVYPQPMDPTCPVGGGGSNGPGAGCPTCGSDSTSTMGAGDGRSGASEHGPAWRDPVNLATGTEEYGPVPDISTYNPHGPSVSYVRSFNSARAGAGYASPGLSPGWTDNYDIKVTRPTQNGTWNDLRVTYQNGSHEDWSPVLSGQPQQPTGELTPPAGSEYLVQGSASGTPGRWNSLTVTFKDQTQWVWTPKSGDPETYLLSTITDRTGHSVTLTRVTGSERIDHISNDQSTVLLQFYYGSNDYLEQVKTAVGLDADMPSVFYKFGTDPNSGLSTTCLLQASTICAFDDITRPVTSIATSLTRFSYGYCARNAQPYLHSTTVLDPASTTPSLTSTAYINYDTNGKVTSLVDANGNQRVYTYDYWDVYAQEYGTRVQIEDASNNVVQHWVVRFDRTNHNVSTGVTDGAGNATYIEYSDTTNNPAKPTTVTDAEEHSNGYSYDAHGNLHVVTNPCGVQTHYDYATNVFGLGRLSSVQEGVNLAQPRGATAYTYDATTGLLLTVTTPPPHGSGGENAITEYTYDSLGNILTSTAGKYLQDSTVHSDHAIVTTYNYTTDGQYSQAAAKGQPLTITVGSGGTTVVTHYRYDGRGNTTSTWDALGHTTTTIYNLANQVTQVTEPASGDTGNGNVHTVSNFIYTGGPLYRTDLYDEGDHLSPVRQVAYTYGHEGEQLEVSGSTEPVTYTYDAAYRQLTVEDGNSSVTHFDYEAETGRLYQTRYPNPDSHAAPYDRIAYTYTPAGHVESRTDGRGQATLYSYNSCGFVTDIHYNGEAAQNVHIEYDDFNRREYMTDATGRTDYEYDDLNNPTSVMTDFTSGPQDQEVSYTYWPNGNRKTMTAPSGTFSYNYDAVGRLNELENPFSETTTWDYYANGSLAAQNLANGASSFYSYNDRGLPSLLDNEVGGGDIFGIFEGPNSGDHMTYDAAGNRTGTGVIGSLADSVVHPGNVYYTYTSKNELATEVSTRVGGTLNQSFAYDDAGNPTTLRGTSSIPYNTDNQRTGSETYVYDGNGDPTTYKGTTLAFDVENRMTAFGNTMTAGYNGDGLRAWKTAGGTTRYSLYDGTNLLCELSASGTVLAANTWGANGLVSQHVGSTSTFYVYDPQGSVAQRLDADGDVLSSDVYDAYGNRNSGTSTDPVGYDGQWGYYTDSETGFALCTYRYYDPGNGRWITRDPIGYEGGANLYAYVGGSPIYWLDPEGLLPFPPAHWPDPPSNIPYGPYKWYGNDNIRRGGEYRGPGQSVLTYGEPNYGGPGYWKCKGPVDPKNPKKARPWQRYDEEGTPITAVQAHPSHSWLEKLRNKLIHFFTSKDR